MIKALVEKSAGHGWIAYHFETRDDNLVCATIVEARAVVVKTVMVNWRVRDSR